MKLSTNTCPHCGKDIIMGGGRFCSNCGYSSKISAHSDDPTSYPIDKSNYVYYKDDFDVNFLYKKEQVLKKYFSGAIVLFTLSTIFLLGFIVSLFFTEQILITFHHFFAELYYVGAIGCSLLFLALGILLILQKHKLSVLDDSSGYAIFYDSMQKPLKVLIGDTFYAVFPKSLCPVCNKKVFLYKYTNDEIIVLCSNDENNRHYSYIDTIQLKKTILNNQEVFYVTNNSNQ